MRTVSYKCPKCGRDYANVSVADDVTWRFCTTCGEKVEFGAPAAVAAPAPLENVSPEARLEYEIRMRELEVEQQKLAEEKKAKNVKLVISIVFALIGVILFVFGMLNCSYVDYPDETRIYNPGLCLIAAAGAGLSIFGIASIFAGNFKKPRV